MEVESKNSSFFLSASIAATYILTAPICTDCSQTVTEW